MHRIVTAAILGLALVFSLTAPGFADSKTVTGEVVDVQCQMKKGAGGVGEAHAGCATSCAKKGAALGILAADGVYAITGDYTAENNKKLIEFVAKKVSATGEVSEADGKKTINVASMALAK
jgi:hypothetical protein